MVIDKLDTDQQCVSSAEYLAALRKMLHSWSSLALSFSN